MHLKPVPDMGRVVIAHAVVEVEARELAAEPEPYAIVRPP